MEFSLVEGRVWAGFLRINSFLYAFFVQSSLSIEMYFWASATRCKHKGIFDAGFYFFRKTQPVDFALDAVC